MNIINYLVAVVVVVGDVVVAASFSFSSNFLSSVFDCSELVAGANEASEL